MDLLEVRGTGARHPWELSRARAVERIVRRRAKGSVKSILDWGCGDGFTGRTLLDRLSAGVLVGVDPHLSDAQRAQFAGGDSRIRLVREEREVPRDKFDLLLLCDVIEHVADDVALVTRLSREFLADDGCLVVTVPAFQALFSEHDRALKHYRRYTLSELESVLHRSSLSVSGSGYLFASLLPARALGKLLERRGSSQPSDEVGIGSWRAGKLATGLVAGLLSLDNLALLALAERGVKAPGLSAWASCERHSS